MAPLRWHTESFRASEDLGAFEFRAISRRESSTGPCSARRNFKGPLDSKIRGRDSTEGIDVYGQWRVRETCPLQTSVNEFLPVRVDDEIMMIERIGSTEFLRIVGRGLFNTAIEEHAAGCTMKEVAAICTGIAGDHAGSSPSSNLENFASHFCSYPDPGSYSDGGGTTFLADHPLAILLQVMLTGGPGGLTGERWSLRFWSFALSDEHAPDWFSGPIRRARPRGDLQARERNGVAPGVGDPRRSGELHRVCSEPPPFGFYATLHGRRPSPCGRRPRFPASDLRVLTDKERSASRDLVTTRTSPRSSRGRIQVRLGPLAEQVPADRGAPGERR